MRRTVECLLAAALIAGVAGLAFGIVVAGGVIVSNGLIAKGGALAPLAIGALSFPMGILLYGLPFAAVMCFTPACYRPWRAVPRLLIGAVAGLALGLGVMALPLGEWNSFQDYRGPGSLPALAACVALATLGLYAATQTIRKEPSM